MKLEEQLAVRADKVIYRDGDSVIKVFSKEKVKSDIFNEALNQARVEATAVNIPSLKNVTCLDDGRWAITIDYIKGKSLAEAMEEDKENIEMYLEKFVELQRFIHTQRVPLLNKLKDKMLRKIGESGLDATIRYELDSILHGMPKHVKLCHGDLNPTNVIIEEGTGKLFVIDWAHATQGNASADVARTYLKLTLTYGKEFANKYLNIYCVKSDTARQYVMKWLPIVSASQMVKGVEQEKEFLMSWINICDYE